MELNSFRSFIILYEESLDYKSFFNKIREIFLKNKNVICKIIMERNFTDFSKVLEDLFEVYFPSSDKNSIERKKVGKFFTKKKICRFINKRALINLDICKHPKILDPACGYGFFIIDILFLLIKESIFLEENNINKADLFSLWENIFKNQINGIEIDKNSVYITKTILKIIYICGRVLVQKNELFSIDEEKRVFRRIQKYIDSNIKNQDFLKINRKNIKEKFDVIVGNPPYIRVHKINSELNTFLRTNFFTPYKDFDIYICFFEQSLHFLRKNGIIGFITPEKFLLREYGRNLRLLLLNNTYYLELIDISRCRDIFSVDIYPIISIIKKSVKNLETKELSRNDSELFQNNNNEINTLYLRIENYFLDKIEKINNILTKSNNFHNPMEFVDISFVKYDYKQYLNFYEISGFKFEFITDPIILTLQDLFDHYPKFGDLLPKKNFFSGTPRAKDYKKVKEGLYNSNKSQNPEDMKYIVSRNIFSFNIVWGIDINSIGKTYNNPFYSPSSGPYNKGLIDKFRIIPKILIKGNATRITAAVDREGYSFNGVYSIILNQHLKEKYGKYLNEDVIVSILNSNLINYYIIKKFQSYMLNSKYLSINNAIISSIPIPISNKNEYHPQFLKLSTLSIKLSKIIDILMEKYLKNAEIEKPIRDYISNTIRKMIERNYETENEFLIDIDLNKKVTIIRELEEIQNIFRELNGFIYKLYEVPLNLREKIDNFFKKSNLEQPSKYDTP